MSALALAIGGCPHDWAAFESVRDGTLGDASDGTEPIVRAPPASSADSTTGSTPMFATIPGEHPTLIAADMDGIVFVTAEGSVLACGHGGCDASTKLAAAQHDVRSLAIGYGFVAWAARGDNVVRRTARTPGQAVEEAEEDDGLVAVALSPTKVYFAVDAIGAVFGTPGVRSCTPGIDCHDLVFDSFAAGQTTALVLDGPDAFWLGDGMVLGCPIATCEGDLAKRTVLATETVAPFALGVDAEQIYWASSSEGGSVRAITRNSLGGANSAPRTVTKNVGTLGRLAVTSSSVWFTNTIAGTVSRAPRSGGPAVVVASRLAAPTGIAASGDHVYVACAGDGRILRWEED